MGQKVNPNGIRLGIAKPWLSNWYAPSRDFAKFLGMDIKIRKFLSSRLAAAGVSSIKIDRPSRNARVTVSVARPGVIIGKSGREIENIKQELSALVALPVQVNIEEVRKPDLNATLVAQSVAQQLTRRVMFRRAMKRSIISAMRLGAKGIKITLAGRLGGAEIARTEWSREGRVPLHTLRADIDYGVAEAHTTYGVIGVKVWIFRGELLGVQDHGDAPERAHKEEAR